MWVGLDGHIWKKDFRMSEERLYLTGGVLSNCRWVGTKIIKGEPERLI